MELALQKDALQFPNQILTESEVLDNGSPVSSRLRASGSLRLRAHWDAPDELCWEPQAKGSSGGPR